MKGQRKGMRKLFFVILTVIIIFASASQVSGTPAVNFSVKAQIPDNQVDTSKTYFDLRLNPEQKQTVFVQVNNNGDKPIIATVTLNPATTGQNGIILYNVPSTQSPGNDISIMDVARVDTPQLRVEAASSAIAEITLEMPKESLDGVLLGGLQFTAEKEGSDSSQDNGNGFSFQNEVNYILALKITGKDTTLSPDFALLGIEAGQDNHRTAVLTTIQNTRPVIVKAMNVKGEIYRKNSNDVYRELTLENVEAAPNSSIPLVFDWENARVESGDYRLKLSVEQGGQEWQFDQMFTIDAQQADNSNRGAVNIVSTGMPGWMWSVFTLLAVLVIAVIYFVYDKYRKRQGTEG